TAFTLEQHTLAIGQQLTFGAAHRASEQTVPWFAVDGPTSAPTAASRASDEFYVALMWSGAWTATFARTSAGLQVSAGLPAMTTTAQGSIDGPHVVFGAASGGMAAATSALRSYIFDGVRAGRPITPLVTYNTRFAYGTAIDEHAMRAEVA